MRRTGFQLVPLCCTGVGPATTSSRLQPIGSSIFYKIKWPVNNKKQKVMREETGLVIVSVVTFFIVLPILCGTWPYSPYYRAASSEEKEEEEDDDDSFFRSYLAGLAGGHEDNNNDSQVTLLVTIVTVRREGQFYLSRVVAISCYLKIMAPATSESSFATSTISPNCTRKHWTWDAFTR